MADDGNTSTQFQPGNQAAVGHGAPAGNANAFKRAQKIARSETTGAMNAGHVAAMEELADAGLIKGKQWSAIGDRDVRQAHLALAGAIVGPRADFDVGGWAAPYPGHWGLPAEQRINCRCTVLSVFDAGDG
jgi:uncharacterized protein with gpF-like domain